ETRPRGGDATAATGGRTRAPSRRRPRLRRDEGERRSFARGPVGMFLLPMRRPCSSLLLAVSLAACGKGGSAPAAPRGPDLSSPEAVWSQASKALEAGDLASLAPFLSEAGARQVRRDLEAWRKVLVD